MGDNLKELTADVYTAYFTKESREQVEDIVYLILKGRPFNGDYTRGLYRKGTKEI